MFVFFKQKTAYEVHLSLVGSEVCIGDRANTALNLEPELGLMLPCNVIVYKDSDNQTVVSIIDPAAMVGMIDNPELNCLVKEARPLLEQALNSI